MSNPIQDTLKAYRDDISHLAVENTLYEVLARFLDNRNHECQISGKITLIKLNEPTPGKSHFQIDPQFFIEHVKNTPWYFTNEITDHAPILPSSLKATDSMQMRCISPFELLESKRDPHSLFSDSSSEQGPSDGGDYLLGSLNSKQELPVTDAQLPDKRSTRVIRKAGKLLHIPKLGYVYNPLLFTRQVVTILFRWLKPNPEVPDNSWTGVILLDPTFQLPPNAQFSIRSSVAWPPLSRISGPDSPSHNPSSTRSIYLRLLERALTEDGLAVKIRTDCHFALKPLYEIVLQNWLIVNEYVTREHATIECVLERTEGELQGFGVDLKNLYICRRRCTKYLELIAQTKEQHRRRGQRPWHQLQGSSNSPDTAETDGDIDEDFAFLETKFEAIVFRIEKSINLITSLVAIGEAQQGLNENRGVARLTLLGTFFWPFSTIATILSIQGDYGPGGGRFWLFWVVAGLFTVLVVLGFMAFPWLEERGRRWVGIRR